jgi:RNA methyltransferase, TrmH family
MNKSITSLQNPYIKDVKALSFQKGPMQERFFLVEGHHLVEEAFKKGFLVDVLTTTFHVSFDESITQYMVPYYILESISSLKTPQAIIGVCKKKQDNVLDLKKPVIYLDKINDPGNLGTIVRTSIALGFIQCVLSKGSVNPYHPKVISSTQGAIFSLHIVIDEEDSILPFLKSKGYHLVATALDNKAVLLNSFTFNPLTVLIMGNESHGVSQTHLEICDQLLMIPIQNIESLNVAIAFGIIAFEINKQLKL